MCEVLQSFISDQLISEGLRVIFLDVCLQMPHAEYRHLLNQEEVVLKGRTTGLCRYL
jgi:hypothetical protein